MCQNENVISGAKKTLVVTILFTVVFLSIIIFANLIIEKFGEEFGLHDKLPLIKLIFNFWIISLCSIPTLYFWLRFFKVLSLKDSVPIQCVVEDIIILKKSVRHRHAGSSIRGHKTMYNISPLLKTPDNKLLFTYNPYDLSVYYTLYATSEKSPYNANIFRNDGSAVKIGETVNVFVKKIKEPKVYINTEKNEVKFSFNRKCRYQNVCDCYDINVFRDVQFFEGFVDVEVFAK